MVGLNVNAQIPGEKTKVKEREFSTSGFFEIENSGRKAYNFNVGWRFYKGELDGAYAVDFDESA